MPPSLMTSRSGLNNCIIGAVTWIPHATALYEPVPIVSFITVHGAPDCVYAVRCTVFPCPSQTMKKKKKKRKDISFNLISIFLGFIPSLDCLN